MKTVFFVALGGAAGAVLRYLVTLGALRLGSITIPLATLFVNVTGSFVMGVFFSWFEYEHTPGELRNFLVTGFLGAYTTFSTFSLETMSLARNNKYFAGTGNLLLNNGLSIAFVFLGVLLGRVAVRRFGR